jgi:hypothetical protein
MDEKVKKSLSDLIDETLMELEELKKSRFDASEVDLKGPGEGIAGKPSNGKLDASKADDEDEDDKDEDKDKDEDDKDMDKGEGQNRQADPDGGHHKAPVEGDKHGQGPSRAPKDHVHVGNGKNNEADPDGGSHREPFEGAAKSDAEKADMDKKEDKKDKKKDKKDHDDDDDKDDKKSFFDKNDKHSGMPEGTAANKSIKEQTSLMKSMIDERVKPLEDKLSTILDLVNKIADQPIAPKGVTSKAIPLFKSSDEGVEKLSKSEISNKLFDMKKSGTKVESLDVTRAELGQDLDFIVKKYNLSK